MEWVYEVWSDESIVTEEMIKKSIVITGISSNLDGSDDHLFQGYGILVNKNIRYKLKIWSNS